MPKYGGADLGARGLQKKEKIGDTTKTRPRRGRRGRGRTLIAEAYGSNLRERALTPRDRV